jgi:hypothetical protein
MEPERERGALASTAGAALLLLLVVLFAFWPVAVGQRSFFHMDLYYEHLPVWEAAQRALISGQSPFWLDGEYGGHPLLFLQEAPLFYPPTVPLLLTGAPVHRLADLFTLAHLWLAGLCAFLLVRGLTGSPAAALFGGTAWMLSARMVQSVIWPNAVAASALVPLVLFGLVKITGGQRRSGVLVAGLGAGLALSTARPHVLLSASPLLLAFAAACLLRARSRRRALADLGLAAVLALAIGAPSVLPSALLLPETSRSKGLAADLADGDLQRLSRGRDLDMVFLPVDGPARWPESAAYAGVLVYGLCLSGAYLLACRRKPFARTAFLACVAGGAAGLLFAFGSAGPYRLVGDLPVLRSFRVPERFLLSWSLALAIGSALALAHWLGAARRPRALAAVCLLGLSADLVWHARRAAQTAEPEVFRVVPEIVPGLRARLAPDESGFPRRILSLAATLNPVPFPDAARLALLREAGALKGALAMRFGLESFNGSGPMLRPTGELLFSRTRRVFALGGVGAVVLSARGASGEPDAFAPPSVEGAEGLPRAFVVPEAVVVRADEAVRAALSPAIDPRRTVVLEEGEPLSPDPAWDPSRASAHLVARSPGRVVLSARLPGPGVLVLLDAWESGWRATADGADVPVLRADAAFRGVRLPAGEHRVEFRYRAPGLLEGIGIGIAGLLGLVLAAVRLRDDPHPPPSLEPPGF